MGIKIKAKSEKSVVKFVNNLKLFGHGYSWGGFESLALHQNVREQGNRKYLKLDKNEYIVRLHIGLEDPNDLIADIKQSLKNLK
jgi:cystathionine beta-lyase